MCIFSESIQKLAPLALLSRAVASSRATIWVPRPGADVLRAHVGRELLQLVRRTALDSTPKYA